MRVAAGEVQAALHCTVIGESDAAVRIGIAGQWEVDIYKEMVLAVEAVGPVQTPSSANERAAEAN